MRRSLMVTLIVAAVILSNQITGSFGCGTTVPPGPCTYGSTPTDCTDTDRAVVSNLSVSVIEGTTEPTVYAMWNLTDPNCKGSYQTICFTSSTPLTFCRSVNMSVTEIEMKLDKGGSYLFTLTVASCGVDPPCPKVQTFLSVCPDPWITDTLASIDVCTQSANLALTVNDPCGAILKRTIKWTDESGTNHSRTLAAMEHQTVIEDYLSNKIDGAVEFEITYFKIGQDPMTYSEFANVTYKTVSEGNHTLDSNLNYCFAISSPNYPDDYDNNVTETYLFINGEGANLYVTVAGESYGDGDDKLELFNGPTTSSNLISYTVPEAVGTTGSTLLVKFTSDSAGVGKGFLAVVTVPLG